MCNECFTFHLLFRETPWNSVFYISYFMQRFEVFHEKECEMCKHFYFTLFAIFMNFWFSARNLWYFIKKTPLRGKWCEIWNARCSAAGYTLITFHISYTISRCFTKKIVKCGVSQKRKWNVKYSFTHFSLFTWNFDSKLHISADLHKTQLETFDISSKNCHLEQNDVKYEMRKSCSVKCTRPSHFSLFIFFVISCVAGLWNAPDISFHCFIFHNGFTAFHDKCVAGVKLGLHLSANRMQMWHVKTMRTFDVLHSYIVQHPPRQRIDHVLRLLNESCTSTSKHTVCEFSLKYWQLTDNIQLFAEHSSHS